MRAAETIATGLFLAWVASSGVAVSRLPFMYCRYRCRLNLILQLSESVTYSYFLLATSLLSEKMPLSYSAVRVSQSVAWQYLAQSDSLPDSEDPSDLFVVKYCS